jgi:hypothetical protein
VELAVMEVQQMQQMQLLELPIRAVAVVVALKVALQILQDKTAAQVSFY